jgi:hypothetical protein
MDKFDRDAFAKIFNEEKKQDVISTCDHNYISVDGYYTCNLCGAIDIDRHIFVATFDPEKRRGPSLYSRKQYFKDKLRFLCCIKQPKNDNENYIRVLNKLVGSSFKTVRELRDIMKEKGLRRYYKYMYTIFYDITHVKLINLTHTEIDNLSNQFVKLEADFKRDYPGYK